MIRPALDIKPGSQGFSFGLGKNPMSAMLAKVGRRINAKRRMSIERNPGLNGSPMLPRTLTGGGPDISKLLGNKKVSLLSSISDLFIKKGSPKKSLKELFKSNRRVHHQISNNSITLNRSSKNLPSSN